MKLNRIIFLSLYFFLPNPKFDFCITQDLSNPKFLHNPLCLTWKFKARFFSTTGKFLNIAQKHLKFIYKVFFRNISTKKSYSQYILTAKPSNSMCWDILVFICSIFSCFPAQCIKVYFFFCLTQNIFAYPTIYTDVFIRWWSELTTELPPHSDPNILVYA